jgi:regulator of RNase E activity RraA
VGRAFPVLVVESYTLPKRPYDRLIDALDSVCQHEVFITNPVSDRAAFWGELLSNACQARGGAGAVIDGLVRDVERIESIGFPVFAKGCRPVDSLGRSEVLDYRVPVVCGGVRVNPGDLVVADVDGVVIVPQSVEREVVEEALHKVRGENQVRAGIRRGESLRQLYDQYGVL